VSGARKRGSQLLECHNVAVDCSALLIREQEILPQLDRVALGFENQHLL
jgi:hypothetical protein